MTIKKSIILLNFRLFSQNQSSLSRFLRAYQKCGIKSIVSDYEEVEVYSEFINTNAVNKKKLIGNHILDRFNSSLNISVPLLFVIDLVNYLPADRVFYDYLVENSLSKIIQKSNLLIFVSDVSYVEESEKIKELNTNIKNKHKNLFLMSKMGELKIIGKKPTKKIVYKPDKDIENENDFKKYLLTFEDVFFPGHFKTPDPSNIHIETYIYTYPLVKNEDCYIYMCDLIDNIWDNNKFQQIVGVGVSSIAITTLGEAIATKLGIKYFYFEEALQTEIYNQISKGNKNILLLTDVLYTGQTSEKVIKKLLKKGAQVNSLFCIIRSNSTRKQIENVPIIACCSLPLIHYYQEKCPYCKYELEPIKLEHPKSYRNYISDSGIRDKILPNEFWRIIIESESLEAEHRISKKGKHYLFSINIARTLERFGAAIVLYLVKKSKKLQLESSIDYIIYPSKSNNTGAQKLAQLFAKELDYPNLLPVNENDLSKVDVKGIPKELQMKFEFLRGKKVIIVDDVVNTFKTLKKLWELTQYVESDIEGSFSFLLCIEKADFELFMNQGFFPSDFSQKETIHTYFYRLPYSPSLTEDECSYCLFKKF